MADLDQFLAQAGQRPRLRYGAHRARYVDRRRFGSAGLRVPRHFFIAVARNERLLRGKRAIAAAKG
jgi:hypothetical protein